MREKEEQAGNQQVNTKEDVHSETKNKEQAEEQWETQKRKTFKGHLQNNNLKVDKVQQNKVLDYETNSRNQMEKQTSSAIDLRSPQKSDVDLRIRINPPLPIILIMMILAMSPLPTTPL